MTDTKLDARAREYIANQRWLPLEPSNDDYAEVFKAGYLAAQADAERLVKFVDYVASWGELQIAHMRELPEQARASLAEYREGK